MTCEELERWLDEGMPVALADEAHAHARSCARCASSLAAALELETLLASPQRAPEPFVERVMARLEAPRFAPAPAPLPWWIRAASEPAAVLALALASALLWGWERVWAGVETLAPSMARVSSALMAWATGLVTVPRLEPLARPQAVLGLELALLCLALVSSPALYRATLRLAARGLPARVRVTASL